MSFDKDYPNRKDRRKPYYGSKKFDRTCRNDGSCDWCKNNRFKKTRMLEEEFEDKLKDYFYEDELNEE